MMQPGGLPRQSATPNQGWNPQVGPPVDFSRLTSGPLSGAIANLLGNSLATNMFGSAGFVPGHMNSTMNLQDTMLARQFQQAQANAALDAGKGDKQFLMQAMRGFHNMSGGGAWGAEQQANAEIMSRRIAAASSQAVNLGLHDTVDALYGSRGSAAVMSQGVGMGLRYMRDPVTGQAYDPRHTAKYTEALFGQLYRPGSDMNGIGAGRAGQMFDEMARRGMMSATGDEQRKVDWMNGGGLAGGNGGMRDSDVRRQAARLKEMSGAVSAVRDLFGANGRANAPMAELFEGLNALTQGSMHWMDGGNMQMMVRRVHSMSRNMSGGLDRFVQLTKMGGHLSDVAGLDRSFGSQTAEGAMAFGHAFGQTAGRQGFGGLSRDEATALDQQLRTSAAASPMANRMGALLAMHEQGLIKGGPAAELVKAIQSRDPAKMAQLTQMDGGKFMEVLRASGVGAATASTFVAGQEANQEQIHRHGLADVVRGMQAHGEVADLMRNQLEAGLMGGLRDSGLNEEQIHAILPKAAEAARQALMGMDGDMISNPEKVHQRNAAVGLAIKNAIGDKAYAMIAPRINEIVATAVRQLEGSIKRNPNLRKFKNLAGLVSMNRGDIHARTHEELRRADAEAEVGSLLSGLGQGSPLSNIMDAVAGAGNDTNLTDVIAKALGGEDKRNIAAALSKPAGEIRNLQNRFREEQKALQAEKDPERRKAIQDRMRGIREKMAPQIKALQDAAAGAGLKRPKSEKDPNFVGPQRADAEGAPGGGGGGGGGGITNIRGTLRLINGGPDAEVNAGPNRAGDVPNI